MRKIGIYLEQISPFVENWVQLTNLTFDQSFSLVSTGEGHCAIFSIEQAPFEGIYYLGLIYGFLHLEEGRHDLKNLDKYIDLHDPSLDFDDVTVHVKMHLIHVAHFLEVYGTHQGVFRGLWEYSIQKDNGFFKVKLFFGSITEWRKLFDIGYEMAKHTNFDFIRKSV